MMSELFKEEIAIFDSLLAGWLEEGLKGHWAVIKGSTLVGTPADYREALELGYALPGALSQTPSFFLRQILEEQPVVFLRPRAFAPA